MATAKEDNFDPFAPVQSDSDIKRTPKATSPELANIVSKQLSQKELDRYIAMMQAAVQENWKVPASLGTVTDPLVEVYLTRKGEVEKIIIIEKSGNAAMDNSLIEAIKRAAPFKLPAQQYEAFRVNRIRFHPLK